MVQKLFELNKESFEYVDFWAKFEIIFYPSLGNLTTHIAI